MIVRHLVYSNADTTIRNNVSNVFLMGEEPLSFMHVCLQEGHTAQEEAEIWNQTVSMSMLQQPEEVLY